MDISKKSVLPKKESCKILLSPIFGLFIYGFFCMEYFHTVAIDNIYNGVIDFIGFNFTSLAHVAFVCCFSGAHALRKVKFWCYFLVFVAVCLLRAMFWYPSAQGVVSVYLLWLGFVAWVAFFFSHSYRGWLHNWLPNRYPAEQEMSPFQAIVHTALSVIVLGMLVTLGNMAVHLV